MCTCITLNNDNKDILLARTMDFSFELEPIAAVIPRNYPLQFTNLEHKLEKHFAFVGLAKRLDDYLLADGVNEYGLACAGLYFENYAYYEKKDDSKTNIAPYEFVNWILANYKSIDDLEKDFNNLNIMDNHLGFIDRTPPMHWMVSDITGKTLVIEPLKIGVKFYKETVGTLTNSPDLNWHLTNMKNYIGLDVKQTSKITVNDTEVSAFGQGGGSFGLPGDYTSPSRFVRVTFSKLNCLIGETEEDLVVSAVNILNSVSIPKGIVVTASNGMDYTQYVSYILLKSKNYYFKTYLNDRVRKLSLDDYDLDGKDVVVKELSEKPFFEKI